MSAQDQPAGAAAPRTPPHSPAAAARLWDISAPVGPASPVFPGDTPWSLEWACQMAPGVPVNVGIVRSSPHVGSHADAPLHYDAQGPGIGHVDLTPFLGPCTVVHTLNPGALVTWPMLEARLAALGAGWPQRLLVRAYVTLPQHFDHALPGLCPQALERLAAHGLQLIGTDSASVDPADSKTLDAHQVLRRHGLRVLENLRLDAVPEGHYELIALPLKWLDADASPVRAVLRELPPTARPTP